MNREGGPMIVVGKSLLSIGVPAAAAVEMKSRLPLSESCNFFVDADGSFKRENGRARLTVSLCDDNQEDQGTETPVPLSVMHACATGA